ncbi:CPBP family intramembrane glutamic endopeptidase [Nocardioides sp. R-C-SC26]|uniref:CPBP family glutamic-type intramembrane protease n=1 Tax=Nocardioides sp. R-C-SC26 TaxID=2870414 RepID=UPI001E4BA618|nr:CPBP family intramembrane glutamic endopeptidase [Nocardioides sp. R-C-SC26]
MATAACLLLGAVVLALSFTIEPGSIWFYPSAVALALVWVAGGLASWPLRAGHAPGLSTSATAAVGLGLGLLLAGVFVLGALVVRAIDPLADQVASVLGYATEGSLLALVAITTVNGIGEELFFRGTAFDALSRRPVLWSTLIYVAVTAATGNIMLTFAAVLLGVLVGHERRITGGVLAPVLTHLAWSLTMLLALPPIFGLR